MKKEFIVIIVIVVIVLVFLVQTTFAQVSTVNIRPISDEEFHGVGQASQNEEGTTEDIATKNKIAFLQTIQYAEGTFLELNPYAVTYAYAHTIQDFSDHPSNTGEWNGEVLPDNFCRAVNLPEDCKSTAAGAYQIIKPTWNDIKRKKPGLLFDEAGQDEAALHLIGQSALRDVEKGRFEKAINKTNTIWASLPNSPYGQPTRSMSELKDFFIEQGGVLEGFV